MYKVCVYVCVNVFVCESVYVCECVCVCMCLCVLCRLGNVEKVNNNNETSLDVRNNRGLSLSLCVIFVCVCIEKCLYVICV